MMTWKAFGKWLNSCPSDRMLTRSQQILLKRAQREAGLEDGEYRDALGAVAGCRSSTDPKLTNRDLDRCLAYLEAIYWRRVDLGKVQAPCKPSAVFRQRRFWSQKNTSAETSRDRYIDHGLKAEIRAIEGQLASLGFPDSYCQGIKARVLPPGGETVHGLAIYKAALQRTLRAKLNQFTAGEKEAVSSRQ